MTKNEKNIELLLPTSFCGTLTVRKPTDLKRQLSGSYHSVALRLIRNMGLKECSSLATRRSDLASQSCAMSQLRPEGQNPRGGTWLRGPEVSGPQGPLRAPERLSGAQGSNSGASERCVRFQRSGTRRWASQRPLRGPVFPDGF